MNDGDDSSSDLTINNAAPDTLTRKPSLKTEQGSFHQKTSVPQLNDDTKFLSHNLCSWLSTLLDKINIDPHMIFKT